MVESYLVSFPTNTSHKFNDDQIYTTVVKTNKKMKVVFTASLTLLLRVTRWCVVDNSIMLDIVYYACSAEELFLQAFRRLYGICH